MPGRSILLSATALALAGRALQAALDYHRLAKEEREVSLPPHET